MSDAARGPTQALGFVVDAESGVHVRPGSPPFGYSDGEAVERRIYDILKATNDCSTGSAELRRAISDWPTEYHFSPVRHNLLRHVALGPSHEVLEIGAGCGAMTRLFGESGARVTAVEGSLARARCARVRCKDLSNVEVYCSNLQDFDSERRFDVVTLIGVLEYAPIYIDDPEPMLACLRMCKERLKPDGVLLIAIENQLGLKYLLGYPEDHVSRPYFGVKDLYHSGTVRTLGRAELIGLVQRAGFAGTELEYPFPDYKLPAILFTERAFATPEFRPEEILQQLPSRDYTGAPRELAGDHFVWPAVSRNGLARDLANSFLVFASVGQGMGLSAPPNVLALGYTTERAAAFNTVKRFSIDGAGAVSVMRARFARLGQGVSRVRHQDGSEPYVLGRHLAAAMSLCIERDAWSDYLSYFSRWLEYLESQSTGSTSANPLERTLPDDYYDCIPVNVVEKDGVFHYIDREWALDRPVMVGTLLLRVLVGIFYDERAKAFVTRHVGAATGNDVLRRFVYQLCVDITPAVIDDYVDAVNAVMTAVYPDKVPTNREYVELLLTGRVRLPGDEPLAVGSSAYASRRWYKRAMLRVSNRVARWAASP